MAKEIDDELTEEESKSIDDFENRKSGENGNYNKQPDPCY